MTPPSGLMFDQTEAELGPVTAFVSNAGVINVAAPLADIPIEEIRRIIDIDLTAHLICNREAVRRMALSRGGKGGAIVNISSKASTLFGAGGFIPYGAAKGGIDVLTQGLGREVAGDGIRINALRPGLIDTEIHDDSGRARPRRQARADRCRSAGPAPPWRWPRPFSGCSRTRPPTSPAPSSTSPAAAEQRQPPSAAQR